MKTFVPYEKLSKAKRREIDRARRGGWGAVNPVTRRPERPDAYKRADEKRKARRGFESADGLCLCS